MCLQKNLQTKDAAVKKIQKKMCFTENLQSQKCTKSENLVAKIKRLIKANVLKEMPVVLKLERNILNVTKKAQVVALS